MDPQNPLMIQATDMFNKGYDLAMGWLLSPAAWVQFAMLVGAYALAWLVSRIITPRLQRLLSPQADSVSLLSKIRRFALIFLPLLLPLFAYGFTAIGEQVTRSIFGSGEVVAFGKRIFLFLAIACCSGLAIGPTVSRQILSAAKKCAPPFNSLRPKLRNSRSLVSRFYC